ncbi:MAG: sigma 54-interacting transcriptional regulator, partial [Desulfitobacteriaceae bacterium]|nr:sigma 54-interacting transcriptional regulator [Desulfitobacteriaceae bacterium]
ADLAHQVIEEMKESILIKTGLLSEGVEMARELEREGCQVVISRGATAKKIKEFEVGITLVEIRLTGHDLIRAFAEAREEGESIALIIFEDMAYDARTIGKILGIKVHEYLVKDESGIQEAINQAIHVGCRVFVGGASTVKYAQSKGLKSKLITSGKEAVWQAIMEAQKVARVKRQEQEKAGQFRAVMDYTYEGILAADAQGTITIFNPAAEKMLSISVSEALKKNVKDVFPELQLERILTEGKEEVGALAVIKGKQIVLNKIPVIVNNRVTGMVVTFQEVSRLQNIERKIRKRLHPRGYVARYHFPDILGHSSAINRVIHNAIQFSKVDSTVLVIGETGVGKEMFAQSIHNASYRAAGPFVAVNCAVLPENLLESELFGYAEGAFTGARKQGRAGLFELAHGGTIFLDELGEMSPNLQSRLLRVLEEKEVMRLGDEQVIPIDVRVIAATNKDLEQLMANNEFRADLFYRLNVLKIVVPPLRERREDIPLLTNYFLKKYSLRLNKEVQVLTEKAMQSLMSYPWPGNIRELENFIERMVVLVSGREITQDDIRSVYPELPEGKIAEQNRKREISISKEDLTAVEEKQIKKVLEETNYNYTRAAQILGINRTTLWRKRKNFKENQ